MSAAAFQKPYVGLRPFRTADAAWFFGRDRESAALARKIRGNRFTAVVGASGSGKSSLVLAGVLPQLVADGWQSLDTKPGEAPIARLAAALATAAVGREDHLDQARRFCVDASLRRSAFGLADVVASMTPNAPPIVLVVDQFEELFRYGEDMAGSQRAAMREEGRAFVELLLTATRREGSRLHVVLTMRSDYFGSCAAYKGLAEAVSASLYLVSIPNRDQLETAIRCPVAKAGAIIDDGLVQRLLVEVEGEADRLPLLQHCLMRLWQQASIVERPEGTSELAEATVPFPSATCATPRRVLDLSAYPGLRESLSTHADEIFTELERQNSTYPRVAGLLFRALTEIDNHDHAIRRPRTMAELTMETGADPVVLQRVIGPFRRHDATFLAPYGDKPLTEHDVVDVSHEALIRCWRRIADPKDGWLQQEFQDGQSWRSLLALADSFEKNPKSVLSPALMEDRSKWLRGRPSTWCERYGGGWQRVAELMLASEGAASKARQRETFWQVVIPKVYELIADFRLFEVVVVQPLKSKVAAVHHRLHIRRRFYAELQEAIPYYNRITAHVEDLRSRGNDIRQEFHRTIELGGDTGRRLEGLWVQSMTAIIHSEESFNNFNRLAADIENDNWRDICHELTASFYTVESHIVRVQMLLVNILRDLPALQQLWIG